MRGILLCSILTLTLLPSLAHAELDQRCFTRSECIEARTTFPFNFTRQEAAEGFYTGADARAACGGADTIFNSQGQQEEVGFCSPNRTIQTKVSFAGQVQFDNIGDFIRVMYMFTVIAGSVLAGIMIVVAGVQWMMSAGNTSVISQAQKRIGKAIIGIVLLVTSYLILTTINPALVNLRPPQVWMIRGFQAAPLFCDVQPNTVALAAQGAAEITPIENISSYPTQSSETLCGNTYYISRGGAQTCQGRRCNPEGICVPFSLGETDDDGAQELLDYGHCITDADMVLHLRMTALVQSILQSWGVPGAANIFTRDVQRKWLADQQRNIDVFAICENSSQGIYIDCDLFGNAELSNIVDNSDITEIPQGSNNFPEYLVSFRNVIPQLQGQCADNGTPVGMIVRIKINFAGNLSLRGGRFAYIGNGGLIEAKLDDAFLNSETGAVDYYIPFNEEFRTTGVFYSVSVTDDVINNISGTANYPVY